MLKSASADQALYTIYVSYPTLRSDLYHEAAHALGVPENSFKLIAFGAVIPNTHTDLGYNIAGEDAIHILGSSHLFHPNAPAYTAYQSAAVASDAQSNYEFRTVTFHETGQNDVTVDIPLFTKNNEFYDYLEDVMGAPVLSIGFKDTTFTRGYNTSLQETLRRANVMETRKHFKVCTGTAYNSVPARAAEDYFKLFGVYPGYVPPVVRGMEVIHNVHLENGMPISVSLPAIDVTGNDVHKAISEATGFPRGTFVVLVGDSSEILPDMNAEFGYKLGEQTQVRVVQRVRAPAPLFFTVINGSDESPINVVRSRSLRVDDVLSALGQKVRETRSAAVAYFTSNSITYDASTPDAVIPAPTESRPLHVYIEQGSGGGRKRVRNYYVHSKKRGRARKSRSSGRARKSRSSGRARKSRSSGRARKSRSSGRARKSRSRKHIK